MRNTVASNEDTAKENSGYVVEVEGNKAEVVNYSKPNRALKNQAEIVGTVTAPMKFEYEYYRECFYSTVIEVPRMSNNKDTITILVSDRVIDIDCDYVGKCVRVSGLIRTYRSRSADENAVNRFSTCIFASEFDEVNDGSQYDTENNNKCYLEGTIFKKDALQDTKSGRQVLRFIMRVGRKYDRSDTVKCVAWGRNAKFMERLCVGDNISVEGRAQSRDIIRRSGGESENIGVGVEVSINLVYKVNE